jgi:hypothetical protein
MDERQFNQLMEKLNLLIKLSALNAIRGLEFKDQVRTLSGLGLQPREIAWITGKTANYVRVTLHELRKEGSKKKK